VCCVWVYVCMWTRDVWQLIKRRAVLHPGRLSECGGWGGCRPLFLLPCLEIRPLPPRLFPSGHRTRPRLPLLHQKGRVPRCHRPPVQARRPPCIVGEGETCMPMLPRSPSRMWRPPNYLPCHPLHYGPRATRVPGTSSRRVQVLPSPGRPLDKPTLRTSPL